MKFEQTFTIGAREMGLRNKLTNFGILSFLEDIASSHSDSVGYGVKDIKTKKKAWLLMDWQLEVLQRPPFGEKVHVKTWSNPIDKPTYHVYRDFEIYNEQKELIGTATSKWVFFDIENGRISKIDNDIVSIYNPEGDFKKAVERIEKLKEPASYENIFEYKVKRADIDINQHMHNLNYLNLAYEALPENIYNSEEMNHVHIMYKHQIKLNDNVKCFYTFEDDKHIVCIKSQDEKTLHAIVELWL